MHELACACACASGCVGVCVCLCVCVSVCVCVCIILKPRDSACMKEKKQRGQRAFLDRAA